MPRFLRAGLPEVAHPLAKDIHLRLGAVLAAVLRSRGCLTLQRQLDAPRFQHLVCRLEKREHPPDAEVGPRLIDDLLELHRRHAEVEGSRDHAAELVDTLAAQQRGQNRHEAGLVIQPLPRLVDDLVKCEVVKPLDELRIGLKELGNIAGEHPLVVLLCKFRDCHNI